MSMIFVRMRVGLGGYDGYDALFDFSVHYENDRLLAIILKNP